MAAYQRGDENNKAPLLHINKMSKNRTLHIPDVLTQIPKVSIKNEKAGPVTEKAINEDSINAIDPNNSDVKAKSADTAFYFIRQNM